MAVILREKVARYEDSHQIHSVEVVDFKLKTTMKKLEHNLYIVIDGPDLSTAKNCLQNAISTGVIAGVGAAFMGVGLSAAEIAFSAAKASMLECLGSGFDIRLESDSQWIYWIL